MGAQLHMSHPIYRHLSCLSLAQVTDSRVRASQTSNVVPGMAFHTSGGIFRTNRPLTTQTHIIGDGWSHSLRLTLRLRLGIRWWIKLIRLIHRFFILARQTVQNG